MRKLKISKTSSIDSVEITNLIAKAESKKLTRKDEEELLIQFKNGDIEVLDKILDSWEWIIINIGKQYLNKGLSIHELMSIGRAGLKRQIERDLDIEQTYRFGTWWIESSIKNIVLSK